MQRRSVGAEGAERLAAVELFDEVPVGERRMLARLVDEITAAAGETLMEQGSSGYEFVMIEDGTAEVRRDGERINTLGAGDFFGELAVLADGAPRSATVTATSDLRGLAFTAHFMREMRARLPRVGERIDLAAAARLARDAAAGRDTRRSSG